MATNGQKNYLPMLDNGNTDQTAPPPLLLLLLLLSANTTHLIPVAGHLLAASEEKQWDQPASMRLNGKTTRPLSSAG